MIGRAFLLVAAGASALWLAGLSTAPAAALQGYLAAFIFWAGLVWGAAGLSFLGDFLGGNWYGLEGARLRAAVDAMPWAALAFVPVAAGHAAIFPWASGGALPAHLQAYFFAPFFWARAAAIWGAWLTLTLLAPRWLGRRRAAVAGLCLYFVLVTAGAIDWIMSLDAPWHSTTFGLLFGIGCALTALTWASAWGVAAPAGGPLARNDAANLLLTLVALWAYLGFTQYLIIWSGNLAAETPWYLARTTGGWAWLAAFLALGGAVLPLATLLFRAAKRSRRTMGALLAVILVSRVADVYWHVLPAFSPGRLRLRWVDAAAFIALGAWFSLIYRRNLRAAAGAPAVTHERGYGV